MNERSVKTRETKIEDAILSLLPIINADGIVINTNISNLATETTSASIFNLLMSMQTILTTISTLIDGNLNQYKAQDEAVDSVDANIEYYGFANTDGNWYILEANATAKTYRYCNGTTGYAAAWVTRETNTYDYIFNLTW